MLEASPPKAFHAPVLIFSILDVSLSKVWKIVWGSEDPVTAEANELQMPPEGGGGQEKKEERFLLAMTPP